MQLYCTMSRAMTIVGKIEYDKNMETILVRVVSICGIDIQKEPARRQVLFRMMMYAHTKS